MTKTVTEVEIISEYLHGVNLKEHHDVPDTVMLTILVPIKKWLESVGRNFKWSVCNGPVFTASRGDVLRARQPKRGRKVPDWRWKVTAFPAKNKLRNSGTRRCCTFTLHIHDRRYVPIKRRGDTNNSPQCITNKIAWPRLSSCVPLGKDIVGYFEPSGWQWQMIIISYLSISPLSSE